mgnify:CR=1 FL=1
MYKQYNEFLVQLESLREIFLSSDELLDDIKTLLKDHNQTYILEAIEKLEKKNHVKVYFASENVIFKILKLIGYKLSLSKPNIAGFYDPSTNTINILIDRYYVKDKSIYELEEHDFITLKDTFVHELVHYVAANNSLKFKAAFSNYWQKFYNTFADIIDFQRRYLHKQIDFISLFNMEVTKNYTITKLINAYFRVTPKNEDKQINPLVNTLYLALKHIGETNALLGIQPIIAETYMEAFNIKNFKLWYMFYQELYAPSEVICILSENDKFQLNILRKCNALI